MNIVFITQNNFNGIKLGRHYLANEIAKNYNLFFIEREDSILSYLKFFEKDRMYSKNNLNVFKPRPKIPLERFSSLISLINQKKLELEINQVIQKSDIDTILSSQHDSWNIFNRNPNSYKAYIVYDDINGYEWSGRKSIISKQEIMTCNSSDDIYVCSKGLMKKFEQLGYSPIYLPHALDDKLFNPNKKYICPSDIKRIKRSGKKILLFFGKLRSVQVDYKLIESIASNNKDIQVVLLGPNLDSKISNFINNLTFLNTVDSSELPKYIYHSDAIFIPYKISNYTDRINSIKTLQGLVFGKPIFTSNFNEETSSLIQNKLVYDLAEIKESLSNIISLDSCDLKEERKSFSLKQTWSIRAEILYERINNYFSNNE